MRRHLVSIGLIGLLAWSFGAAPRAITVESLLGEMTDLAGMAEFPEPAYTTRQFSSYDRKSVSPTKDWFANGDAGQYLRVEDKQGRKEHVMMDAAGPGAIVRIWSANPKGTLRIYIDGGETPALEAKMTDLLGGTFPGLPKPIAGERSKGWNLYFPVPYAKSCKVTSDEGGFYYHVNYRTYAPGTTVVSFTTEQLRQLSGRVTQVAERLASPRGTTAGDTTMDFQSDLSPGAVAKHSIQGANAITGLVMRLPERSEERRVG